MIDDLGKFRGLHSVSAYGHGPVYSYRSMPVSVTQHRVQELCESRGGRPGLPVLMSLRVSLDVEQR